MMGSFASLVAAVIPPPPPPSAAFFAPVKTGPTLHDQVQAHDQMQQARAAYIVGLTALAPVWQPLPTAPYPPIGDEAGFTPATGTLSLRLNRSQISADALKEPARAQAGLAAQARARRPSLAPMFWVGLACLGTGLYLSRKR